MIKRIKAHFDRKKRREEYIRITIRETGWPREEAKEKMDACVEKGISYNMYVTNKLYLLTDEMIDDKIDALKSRDDRYVDKVCMATGWTREHALTEMERTKERLKLSYNKYYKYRFFSMTDKEMDEKLDEWRRARKEQNEYVALESGWSMDKIRLEIRRARTVFDIPPDYYVLYRLWELTDDEILSYARTVDSVRIHSKYNDANEVKVLGNKETFNNHYKDYIKRKFWVNRDTTFEEFKQFIEGLEYIFCKPVDSGGGQGTEKIKPSEHNPEELFNYLMNKNKMLVEEFVVQHKEIDKFSPGCVNTIRVITLLKDGVCNFIAASIRIGNKGIVDNFHKDGMVCDVDVDTGVIVTNAIDRQGTTYERHPVTDHKFIGFQIPNWEMVLEIAENAIKVQDGVNYVGWDIAVCENKAVIIEGNYAPGMALVQAPYAREKKGRRYLLEPYI